MGGKEYLIAESPHALGRAASTGNRCALCTSYATISAAHFEAVKSAGGNYINYENQVLVRCAKCQKALSNYALGLLILKGAPHITGMIGLTSDSAQAKMCDALFHEGY